MCACSLKKLCNADTVPQNISFFLYWHFSLLMDHHINLTNMNISAVSSSILIYIWEMYRLSSNTWPRSGTADSSPTRGPQLLFEPLVLFGHYSLGELNIESVDSVSFSSAFRLVSVYVMLHFKAVICSIKRKAVCTLTGLAGMLPMKCVL